MSNSIKIAVAAQALDQGLFGVPAGKPYAGRRYDGRVRPATPQPKVGRNKECPCGSGRKFKKCCGAN